MPLNTHEISKYPHKNISKILGKMLKVYEKQLNMDI